MTATLRNLVEAVARAYPWPVEASEELRGALAFLDWDVPPTKFVQAGYGAGLITGLVSMLAVPFAPSGVRTSVALIGVVFALLVAHLMHSVPRVAATAKRTSALGAAPDLVSRAVLSMRLAPTPERAAEFAAQSSNTALADNLESHVRQTRSTARSGLLTFGDTWSDLFPSLRRSFALIMVAGRTPAEDRYRLLDRALAVVLDGTRDTLQQFAARIRAPVTALYAFGVLLPTALVALLPAAGAAGVVVTPATVVVLYNVLLPAALVTAAVWLLARRPVAFPPPQVTWTHPEVSDRRVLALVSGGTVAAAGWLVAARLFPSWGPPVGAVGLGFGTGLVVVSQPVISVYERIRSVEDGLSDALELIGRRVANGCAVETAIEQVADEIDGPMGEVLAGGSRQQRQLHVSVNEAFRGRHGVLTTVPSRRVRGSFALLALAAKEGRPAGTALLALAEHLDDLQRIERDARQRLDSVCRTLTNTATMFGPMVAGATVALADVLSSEESLTGSEQSFVWLGGPVGVYVLLLALVLTALSVGLIRGFDRALVGFQVGRALISSTLIYLCSYLFVGAII